MQNCLDQGGGGRKQGFIPHYHNGIRAVDKGGISAPTVAFGEDPSLFPALAGPCRLKKRGKSTLCEPLFIRPARSLQQLAHRNTHTFPCVSMCICVFPLGAGETACPARRGDYIYISPSKRCERPSAGRPVFCSSLYVQTHHFHFSAVISLRSHTSSSCLASTTGKKALCESGSM